MSCLRLDSRSCSITSLSFIENHTGNFNIKTTVILELPPLDQCSCEACLNWIFISVLFGYVNVNGLLFAEIKSDQLNYTPMMTAEKLTEFFTVEIISMLSRQTLLKVYLYDHVKCGKKTTFKQTFYIFGE